MESLSERILCEIARRLARIREADGYLTNAGLHVFRARRTLDERDLPAVVVWDSGEAATKADGASRSMAMTLSITIDALVAADQGDTGCALERVKADVKRALLIKENGGLDDEAGHIGVLIYLGAQPTPREDGASSESISLQFSVVYRETYGDPTSSK